MAHRYSFIDPFASALSGTIVLSSALPELRKDVSKIVRTAGSSWSAAAAEDAPADKCTEHTGKERYEGYDFGTYVLLTTRTEDELNMHRAK